MNQNGLVAEKGGIVLKMSEVKPRSGVKEQGHVIHTIYTNTYTSMNKQSTVASVGGGGQSVMCGQMILSIEPSD